MQIKEILLGIPLVIFIFWVFSAPLPKDRIERSCSPVRWVGNLATSTTALATENHTGTAVRWSDKLDYSCQYMIWRLFYQSDYNQAIKDGRVQPVEGYEHEGRNKQEDPSANPPTAQTPQPIEQDNP